jgi:molybdopterin/thiamine biosynthesis adenylyltransferase
MATIRLLESVHLKLRGHLLSGRGEHFAFMLARWTRSQGTPIFVVHDVVLVPDSRVSTASYVWEIGSDGFLPAINAAVKSGSALIEAHNHGGRNPRFSATDRSGLAEFVPYVFDSLPRRPYAATVWGDDEVYGEFFLPDGQTGIIGSITSIGSQLRQCVSGQDRLSKDTRLRFGRQIPWFTEEGQERLGKLRAAIVGLGGTGSHLIQNLVYLGLRDFVLIDQGLSDQTSMNRLITARSRDIARPKTELATELAASVFPGVKVQEIRHDLRSLRALDAIKGVDVIFGCVDNDGARLILNEIALAYRIPYFDLAVGIEANNGVVSEAGGRVVLAVPEGPCLECLGEIDREEAAFFLANEEERRHKIDMGYVQGMDVPAPSVVSLNGAIAAAAVNEFVVFLSGIRSPNVYTELDLLGKGRPLKSQWMVPRRVEPRLGCFECALAGVADKVALERYVLKDS